MDGWADLREELSRQLHDQPIDKAGPMNSSRAKTRDAFE